MTDSCAHTICHAPGQGRRIFNFAKECGNPVSAALTPFVVRANALSLPKCAAATSPRPTSESASVSTERFRGFRTRGHRRARRPPDHAIFRHDLRCLDIGLPQPQEHLYHRGVSENHGFVEHSGAVTDASSFYTTDAAARSDYPAARAELAMPTCVSLAYLRHHRVCPIRFDPAGNLVIATAEESFREAVGELASAFGRAAVEELTTAAAIEELIDRLRSSGPSLHASVDDDDADGDVRDMANQPPVIRYVNLLLRDASETGASDVHLDASRSGVVARYRIDGVLVTAPDPPPRLHNAVVSRIKLLADLDIAERRMPQDGRLRMRVGTGDVDIRVSTVPTMFGESVVMRLLERGGRPVELGALGMDVVTLEAMRSLSARAHGMVLVTGPTGSGKTTTLYAALQLRDRSAEKIVTVEDPVEYQLAGVTQIPVRRDAGVTFGSALRSILRQDPDVIMIGEMRDTETAEIAVQAAMTGHLVFSTLHTNDAVGAIPRLLDLGVPPYLLASTLSGVLAQRLVRLNCESCSVAYDPDPSAIRKFERERECHGRAGGFRAGVGCADCRGTGFSGRAGLFELITIDDSMRDAIVSYRSRSVFRELARRSQRRAVPSLLRAALGRRCRALCLREDECATDRAPNRARSSAIQKRPQ